VKWMGADPTSGAFRVLWLGDSRSLNQGSWSVGNGLAYATSEDGSPDARWLWNAADPGPAAGLASAVNLARSDRTDRLGSMLAPAGVRYVVMLTSLAPEIVGEQSPQQYPVPADLAPALSRQLDLNPVVSGTGITVYANAAWLPERAVVPGGRPVVASQANPVTLPVGSRSDPSSPLIPAAVPVLPGPPASRSYRGAVPAGTVLAALAPSGRWSLVVDGGGAAARTSSFGWAGSYPVTRAGAGTLRFDGGLVTPVSFLVSLLVWLTAVAFVSVGGLSVSLRRVRTGRRRTRADDQPTPDGYPPDVPAADGPGAVGGVQ